MSDVQPMTSARIYAGRYEVLGTSTHCEIVQKQFITLHVWALYSDGNFVKSFDTKREALQYCQEHSEL
jgi:hypothetical protein